jgi:hypothetical protein
MFIYFDKTANNIIKCVNTIRYDTPLSCTM